MVGLERAAGTGRLPVGVVHQMMDDALPEPIKEISEGFLALRRLEDILLLDLDPGQSTPFGAQAVSRPHVLLLLDQERLTQLEPFLVRYDLHSLSPFLWAHSTNDGGSPFCPRHGRGRS